MADATDDATNTAVSVGTSAVLVLANRAGRRRSLLVQNVHASANVYLGLGAAAAAVTTSTGIKLTAGATFADSAPDCYSGPIYAVSDTASTPMRVVEF